MKVLSMLMSRVHGRGDSLRKREEGVTMIEYALLAALIAVAMVAAIILIKGALEGAYTDVASGFDN